MATAATRVKTRPKTTAPVAKGHAVTRSVAPGELVFDTADSMPSQHRTGRRTAENPFLEKFHESLDNWDEETDAGGVIVVHLNTGSFVNGRNGGEPYSKSLSVAKRRIREAAMSNGYGVSIGIEPPEDELDENQSVKLYFQARHRRPRKNSA
jgi:hypothetical protein